jgi:sulfite reductase alpha subunit-like flavoprotein
MRDFKVAPQYDYCCDPWKVLSIGEIGIQSRDSNQETTNDNTEEHSIPKLLIAYGSETGTAEAAAASLAKRFKACKPFLCTLNEVTTKIETLKTFDHILIICSTFGKGNPPNNAVDFFKSDLTGKLNEHTWFAVLALGSSLYPDYCKAGEEVGEQMKEAGAQPIMEIRRVDTAHGNQAMILEWSNQAKKLILPDSILESIKASDANRGRQRIPPTYSVKWRVEEEFQGDVVDKSEGALRCSKNIELFDEVHAQISQRSTRHIEFELPEEMTYETADNLSVTPHNSIEMIARLVNCFAHELEKAAIKMGYFSMPHLDAEVKQLLILMGRKFNCTPHIAYVLQQPFYIECIEDGQINAHPDQNMTNKSLLHVFREVVDLSFNSAPYLVDFLSMLLSKLDSASLSSVEAKSFRDMATPLTQQDSCEDGDERIKDFSDRYPTAPDLLENFEDLFCKPFGERKEGLMNLADILVLMPKLKPRLYSISSSDLVTPRNISITAGLVNFTTTAMVTVKGVCSHHLARLNPGDQLNAKIIKSSFRLPLSNTSPIIMIGAGTGLAPYMGFLREREEYMSQSGLHFGKCHLFFGCRSDDEYLYMDQLQQWQNEEIMELHIAQTREAEKPRKQVQHSLADHGAELVELLMSEEKTHVYICGNAIMADSCREAFIELLKTHGNMSKILATQMLASMHIDNRWHLDVWGSTKEIDIGIDISSHPPRRDLGKSQFSFIRRFVHKNSMVESRDIYPLVE